MLKNNIYLNYFFLFIIALNHGLADFISGFIVVKISTTANFRDTLYLITLYNFLAFVLQFPFGVLADKINASKSLLITSLLFLTSAFLLYDNNLMAVILAGIGSCIFHVIAGKYALNSMPQKAKSVGIFAAPGIIGLALGAYLAFKGFEVKTTILILSSIIGIALLFINNNQKDSVKEINQSNLLEKNRAKIWFSIIILSLAISLNSVIWDVYQILNSGQYTILLWIGIATGIGKLAGSFIADYIGWEKYSTTVFTLSIICLFFSQNNLSLLLVGIGLMQSVTGVGVTAMHLLMPNKPATAVGLTLGFTLAIGGIPFLLGLDIKESNPYIISLILFIVLVLYHKVFKESNLLKSISSI